MIVIEAELEAWIRNENQHLAEIFHWPGYRKSLAGSDRWPESTGMSSRPEEGPECLRRHHRVRAFNAEFDKLPAAMSVWQRQDPAVIQLCDQLLTWFPAEQS